MRRAVVGWRRRAGATVTIAGRHHGKQGEAMANREAQRCDAQGNLLVRPICGHERFWMGRATVIRRFWFDREAVNVVSERCGSMGWFARGRGR